MALAMIAADAAERQSGSRPLAAYVDAAARCAGVSREAIVRQSRIGPPTRFRMAAMALAHRDGWPSTQVSMAFGWRDHTTVLHAYRAWHDGRLSREAAEIGAALRGDGA